VKTGPLGQIGGQGLFTKEIQRALLAGEVDLAVHSLKDLPTTDVEGLALAAVPEREGVCDVIVSSRAKSLLDLPVGCRVGTGSLRRRAQLLHHRPDLTLLEIRGNLDTRLRKLDEGQYDAIILAEAGLRRLGMSDRIAAVLQPEVMLPAVGQGALGIETRQDDAELRATLLPLNHAVTQAAVIAERALLATLRAGCLAPVGAWGRMQGETLVLDAVVVSPDGKTRLAVHEAGPIAAASMLGRRAGDALLAQGATAVIAAARAV
jgi:hydroxymethylbilane synthase